MWFRAAGRPRSAAVLGPKSRPRVGQLWASSFTFAGEARLGVRRLDAAFLANGAWPGDAVAHKGGSCATALQCACGATKHRQAFVDPYVLIARPTTPLTSR